MKKTIILITFLFFLKTLSILAQNILPDPISQSTTNFTLITSGYGPRYTTGSIFHPGIDYTLPAGNSAYAIEPGSSTINSFYMDATNGYVIIGNWKYQHILLGSTTNNHWALRNVNGANYIFIRTGTCSNSTNCTTIHAYSNNTGTIRDPFNAQDILIETLVPQGSQIFVSHDGDMGNHLHLQNTGVNQNPLTFVAHSDATNSNITIVSKFKYYTQVNTPSDFQGTSLYGNAIVTQAEVNATIDKDLDNLQIQISTDGINFGELHSYYFTNNRNVFEANIIQLSSIAVIENQTSNGIYPVYEDFGHLFFKYVWNSRELPSINANPTKGNYPDGHYTIKMLAHDVTGHETVNISEKTIDNFRPYIQKVEIKSGTTDVYKGEWVWNAANMEIEYIPNGKSGTHNPQDGIIAKAARDKNITIKITASEPLSELSIVGITPTTPAQAITATYPINGNVLNTNRTVWEFIINASAFKSNGVNDGVHFVHFNGKDLADNAIENFSPSKTSYLESEIPKHINATTWTPLPHTAQGFDGMHCFEIGGNGGANPLSVTINANKSQVQVGESVTFSAVILDGGLADPDSYSYYWVFKEGNTYVSETTAGKTVNVTFSAPALITAEVTLSKNSVNAGYGIKKDIVNVGAVLQATITSDKEFAMVGESITVTASASGGLGNYTYSWTFSNDCSIYSSTNKSATISYSNAGTKTITLIVTSGSVTKTVTKSITISEGPQLTADFQNGLYENNYIIDPTRLVQFISIVQNASGIVHYYWDFGDNTPYLDPNRALQNPIHEYPNEGIYTVTLQVTDDNCSRIVSHTYKVSSLGSLITDFTATPSTSDQTVTFNLTTNEYIYAFLDFGELGSTSQVYHISPVSSLNPTITYKYSSGGSKTVRLKVWKNENWNTAVEKNVVVYSTPLQPQVAIEYTDWGTGTNKPYLSAWQVDITPFAVSQGTSSNDSPCDAIRGDEFFYRYSWTGVGYIHANEPCASIDLNYPGIQEQFKKNKPYVYQAWLTVQGATQVPPNYYETYFADREITIYPPITTNLKTTYTICPNNTFQLTPEVKGGKPPYIFEWRNGTTVTTEPSLVVGVGTQPINYTLRIGDSRSGMSAWYEFYKLSFTIQPSSLNVDAGSPVTLCSLDDISTINANVSGGSGKYVYSWEPYNNISSTTILNPNVASTEVGTKTYTLKVTDEFGCTASDQVNVAAYKAIQIDLEPTYYVNGNVALTISPNISNGSGNFSYSWSNGATTKNISVNQQTSLNLTLTVTDNTSGCIQTASCKVISLSSNITTPNTMRRGKNSYTIIMPVTSSPGNISYTAHTGCSWLTISSGANGYTGDNVILNLSGNNTSYERIGKIILESPEALNSPYEIVLTQSAEDILRVPEEYGTIQAAINAALDGGKVEVDEGIYRENIVFSGTKKISVKATGCPENTIIKAIINNKPVVTFLSNSSILQGFKITGGYNPSTNLPGSGEGGGYHVHQTLNFTILLYQTIQHVKAVEFIFLVVHQNLLMLK